MGSTNTWYVAISATTLGKGDSKYIEVIKVYYYISYRILCIAWHKHIQ